MAAVLVVDDAPDVRTLLAVRLSQCGHRVLSADSGEDALAMLAQDGALDIAVLDVQLPGMTGLELCTRLRQDPSYASVPVIFLSDQVTPEDLAAGRELGATYLPKPVVVSALTEAIDTALVAAAVDVC